ncbi:MAG: T9SS type A sorting domain-containing protein, partial [Bacteroidota bacterium]
WVYNDKGNIHTETGADQIGMEIQALAFGFETDDDINNMSFYKYTLLNKATTPLNDTYIANWVDPDLGCFEDDFVGCNLDVIGGKPRDIGIVYNGEAVDNDCGVPGYGSNVPMLGVDYFRGPRDENGQELGMSAFIFYNNDFSVTGNPEQGPDFYGYMSGFWKDGSPVQFGGTGFQQGTEPTPYMFPSDPSIPAGPGIWSECSEGNDPADRRFVQASGPFTLEPGATNEVIVGAVWVPTGNYPCPEFAPLLGADDIAQALFDNCFDILDGPDAPDLEIVELDQELVVSLYNIRGNNIAESYDERDPFVPAALSNDTSYLFEGYVLYQLSGPDVSSSEFDDFEKARPVAIVDVQNGIDKAVNYVDFPDPDFFDGKVPIVQVESPDAGIRHSFRITQDLFATGDPNLVNNRKYYFAAIAWGYNNWQPFNVFDNTGQERQYLAGRRNIRSYTAIPHKSENTFGGTTLNAEYGNAPEVTRIDGEGSSGAFLNITDATEDEILTDGFAERAVYEARQSPVNIQVVNPFNVPSGTFNITFFDNTLEDDELTDSIYYSLTSQSDPSFSFFSERTVDRYDEQLVGDLGISIGTELAVFPGDDPSTGNGEIASSIGYEDAENQWYGALSDGPGLFNFIRTDAGEAQADDDPFGDYSGVVGGFWYPYPLVAWRQDPNGPGVLDVITPAWTNNFSAQVDIRNQLDNLESVDVVLTSDKSKWSRCIVVNTFSRGYQTEGLTPADGTGQYDLRAGESIDQNGVVDGDGTSMSWFPGYAINVETGERLNIFFGENTYFDDSNIGNIPELAAANNGNDMIWNPNDQFFIPVINPPLVSSMAELPVGGQHYIYVTDTRYDSCATLREQLSSTSPLSRINAWSSVIWTSIPLLAPGTSLNSVQDGLIPNDVRFQMRVTNPYQVFEATGENDGYPQYEFNFDGFASQTNQTDVAVSALDNIQVVPNPYFAFSAYESTQFENIVKITNLPAQATVTIFSMDGRLIRRFNRNEVDPSTRLFSQNVTSLEWDLRNSQQVPIASGVYLIHIDAGELGERVLKWFGTIRQFDTAGL